MTVYAEFILHCDTSNIYPYARSITIGSLIEYDYPSNLIRYHAGLPAGKNNPILGALSIIISIPLESYNKIINTTSPLGDGNMMILREAGVTESRPKDVIQ